MKKTSLKEMLTESTGTEFLKSKEEIEAWLEEYEVKDYEIHDDLTVTLNEHLDLSDRRLKSIPVKFRKTQSVNVTRNELTSIDWAPEVVDGHFECNGNQITSLESGPREVKGLFNCIGNKLTSLEGGPQKVGGFYACSANNLGNLKGVADEVGASVDVSNCNLTSLEFLPSKIGANLYFDTNKITSFRGIYKVLKEINTANDQYDGLISFRKNPIEKGLISLMGIKGIKVLDVAPNEEGELQKAIDIINNSLENNIDAFATQKLLADAGLMKYS